MQTQPVSTRHSIHKSVVPSVALHFLVRLVLVLSIVRLHCLLNKHSNAFTHYRIDQVHKMKLCMYRAAAHRINKIKMIFALKFYLFDDDAGCNIVVIVERSHLLQQNWRKKKHWLTHPIPLHRTSQLTRGNHVILNENKIFESERKIKTDPNAQTNFSFGLYSTHSFRRVQRTHTHRICCSADGQVKSERLQFARFSFAQNTHTLSELSVGFSAHSFVPFVVLESKYYIIQPTANPFIFVRFETILGKTLCESGRRIVGLENSIALSAIRATMGSTNKRWHVISLPITLPLCCALCVCVSWMR